MPQTQINDVESASRLDIAFANFLGQRTTFQASDKQRFTALLTLLSQQNRQGHTCIDISQEEKALLLASGFACDYPHADPQAYPLIIDAMRLYLQRYWHYENRLAQQVKQLANINYPSDDLDNWLDQYFPKTETIDWQKQAAKLACQQAFSIITGGPGTGKTTTVCKILALLQALSAQPLLIALAAPTGKAVMRLQEAVALALSTMNCQEDIQHHVPKTAVTLHRLLGANPPSPYFKHDADKPLPHDVVVVDEASMVDLALMSKLVDALKPGAKLILLGDKDQLASIEAGAVLADLIAGLPKNTVELTQAYRFDGSIKQLADAVNRQDHESAWAMITSKHDAVNLIAPTQLLPYIIEQRKGYARMVLANAEFGEIYKVFNQLQVLCSNRHGVNGALTINNLVEQHLFNQHAHGLGLWYAGRPVMVTQNHPTLQLYNGDIGICLPDKEQNDSLVVFFQRPDGSVKKLPLARMPVCETVFAMTIHKAQGSEFNEILIALPPEVNPVLSKELIYTAITRAKTHIKIAAEQSIFTAAISKKIGRVTGLATKLIQY